MVHDAEPAFKEYHLTMVDGPCPVNKDMPCWSREHHGITYSTCPFGKLEFNHIVVDGTCHGIAGSEVEV